MPRKLDPNRKRRAKTDPPPAVVLPDEEGVHRATVDGIELLLANRAGSLDDALEQVLGDGEEAMVDPEGPEDKGGRPAAWQPEFIEIARRLAQLGATDWEAAQFFGIRMQTLYRWQHSYPGFSEALKVGKELADDRVERSLYRRALGYHHDAVKIFNNKDTGTTVVPFVEHVPPDVTACIFWLKNRRREIWRDKIDHEHKGNVTVVRKVYDADDRKEGGDNG